jgi:hypothetical protein
MLVAAAATTTFVVFGPRLLVNANLLLLQSHLLSVSRSSEPERALAAWNRLRVQLAGTSSLADRVDVIGPLTSARGTRRVVVLESFVGGPSVLVSFRPGTPYRPPRTLSVVHLSRETATLPPLRWELEPGDPSHAVLRSSQDARVWDLWFRAPPGEPEQIILEARP